ncbi:response regulator [Oceanobacillus profundus]|uniref:Response regulator n=1 Tax=Oceanobacillus profundus TaxID=372463 RepID=A0A417YDA0_9BACI|nr:response regulator [Oceanobacillus profundus]MBR3117831.1 response regulator [Oceanobacillus sp.]PAE28973.1 response regulator [Paenibacillus sp. 7884-2]MCM3397433.1 response regulator [Oceanobacillus profundus]MDO6448682.1 response regulator [Oceanobacillus profundus]RHW30607.1 response regulator [Oceanobacillus profundus]
MIKVAMIEDDVDVSRFHRLFLNKIDGFELIFDTHTLEDGLKKLKQHQPDLLLLDVYIGTTNGLDLLKKIRAEGIDLDVILITSANDAKTVQTGHRFGVVDYLIKPFSFKRFQKALNRYRLNKLDKSEVFSQQEVDRLFHKGGQNKVYTLPKGITKETAFRIMQCLIEIDDWLTATELAEKCSISHVSLRKYLRFFEEEKLIETQLIYQVLGRPLQKYKATIDAPLFLEAGFI